ncbi:MAG TPA: winged helix-turn-helix domain-containing protein [Rubrobacter sp.]|nr:winged helix-turn-helix domain-containing protein [Rubrobacter sp.]
MPLRHKPLFGKALRKDGLSEPHAGCEKEARKSSKIDKSATRLLEEDVRERPAATVKERRRFLEHLTGKTLSEPTLRRWLKRLGFSRKKGLWGRWNETSSEELPGE